MSFARKIGFSQILFAPDGDGGAGGGTSTGASGAPAGGGGEPSAAPSSASPSGASPAPSTPSSGETAPPDGGAGTSPPGTPPAPPTTPRTPIGSSFEFLDESDDGDIDELTELASPAAPAAPVAAQPVTPPGATPATPAQAAPTQAPVAPAVTPAPGPQEATPPIPSPAEPHRIAEQMQANFDALADHLAATEFKLSEADIEALETDAPAHIPKIMSRLYMKTQINMMQQLARIVPEMYQRFNTVVARNEKNEGKFYTRWPSINREQHGDMVKRLANTYRQMNPAATLEQMIEDLGPIVMMTAKIPLNASPPAANGSGAPIVPPTRNPPSPFRPAIPGSGASQQQGAGDNPWGGLAGDQDEE